MSNRGSSRRNFLRLAGSGVAGAAMLGWPAAGVADVRAFGAAGDGNTLDTAAVNRAIAAAARAGGEVHFPAGSYACHTIHLRSHVTLRLAKGATILAAPAGGYDAAEPNRWDRYQDFGHSHFHNSLICGEDVHDVAILGPGLIWGRGLSRDALAIGGQPSALATGTADKAIALKNCRNVTLRDFSILAGGHFAVLATGVDNLTIDNLTIDTNRDGIDIDSCRKVRVTNCRVNSPHDDSICLKSSFALGYGRDTEDVTISNCYVTGGYRIGTLIDGTRQLLAGSGERVSERRCMMGRIKLGTESNGGFRNVTIEDCVCESCLGLALESVDGGVLENVVIRKITMRDIRNAPVFVRLGARLRGPPGTLVGALRGISVSDLICHGSGNDMPVVIAGIPGHPVEDIAIRDAYLLQKGGGSKLLAGVVPPEEAKLYPETDMFGPLPAQGVFARHVRNLVLGPITFASVTPDARPFLWLEDVTGGRLSDLTLPPGTAAPKLARHEPRKLLLSGTAAGRAPR
jgi:polygalacturonase